MVTSARSALYAYLTTTIPSRLLLDGTIDGHGLKESDLLRTQLGRNLVMWLATSEPARAAAAAFSGDCSCVANEAAMALLVWVSAQMCGLQRWQMACARMDLAVAQVQNWHARHAVGVPESDTSAMRRRQLLSMAASTMESLHDVATLSPEFSACNAEVSLPEGKVAARLSTLAMLHTHYLVTHHPECVARLEDLGAAFGTAHREPVDDLSDDVTELRAELSGVHHELRTEVNALRVALGKAMTLATEGHALARDVKATAADARSLAAGAERVASEADKQAVKKAGALARSAGAEASRRADAASRRAVAAEQAAEAAERAAEAAEKRAEAAEKAAEQAAERAAERVAAAEQMAATAVERAVAAALEATSERAARDLAVRAESRAAAAMAVAHEVQSQRGMVVQRLESVERQVAAVEAGLEAQRDRLHKGWADTKALQAQMDWLLPHFQNWVAFLMHYNGLILRFSSPPTTPNNC